MGLFGKKPEKSELTEKSSEDVILEHVNKIAKDNDAYRLLRLFIRIIEETPNDIDIVSSFYGLSRCNRAITGGFYQFLSSVDYPFYPGDILLFSHKKEYKNGDVLQYCDVSSEGKISLHYLIFGYKNEEGLVVRSVDKRDEKKYTIRLWQVLGKMVFKYEFGSNDWWKFLTSDGIEKDKIMDDLERSIKYITDSKEFIDRDSVLSELNRRKEILKKS